MANDHRGNEGAPVPSKGKNAPIKKQGQEPGTRYGQNPGKKAK